MQAMGESDFYGPYTADIEAYLERLMLLKPFEAELLADAGAKRTGRDYGILQAEVQMYAQGEGWAEGLVRARREAERLAQIVSRSQHAGRAAREGLTALLSQHFLPADRFIAAYAPFAAVIGWPTVHSPILAVAQQKQAQLS